MKYYYRMNEEPYHEKYEYLETEQIATIPLYEVTKELEYEYENDPMSDLWPVHDPCGYSWVAKDYKNEDEARIDLGTSINLSVYEYIHDI